MNTNLVKKLCAALLLACLLVTPAQAETVTYLHTDLLGSVVLETDQNRNVVARYEYEPYGLPRQAMVDQPGYTGHVHDAGSGLVYMQQRYYDPEVGRFLSIDPVGVDIATGANFNRYWYADNNPYTFVDPDGRNAVTGLGGVLTETRNLVTGRGFDWDSVVGAFADGYNGEGSGPLAAAFEDVATFGGGAVLGAATKVAAGLVKVGKALDAAGDVAGAGRGGTRATAHGAERLARSGFTDDLVKLTKTEGQVLHQSDGAKVFLRESSPGRFDFIVEGERGVITAHRNWSQKSIDGIAKNYGWGQ
ncbi:RHS repeat-associated core domain-containing protein [Thioalkalivibrio sp. XN279]|uniref:RHS repeat-associated core domain-containing protein n=1 Tax=Thioalkalivibrio sp. XN279 TaxID=2714953 RepID=UPI00140C716C|nr:RHS repeat-associated core domain-containing protein [Thioalkalivibrio sp. XN279]NHA16187.1 RHS repeat-associated core domain-containing protein [Thioalkalivibrio sp. XN279]